MIIYKLRALDNFEEVYNVGKNRESRKGGSLTTWNDVMNEISDALGEYADDFDIDGIAAECYTLAAYIADDGTQLGNAMYVQLVDDLEFWESVKRHAL